MINFMKCSRRRECYACEALDRPTTTSNAVTPNAYANLTFGLATNEAIVIGANTFTLTQFLDSRHRPIVLGLQTAAALFHYTYTYDAENRLASVSNDVFTVDYTYTSVGLDAGYTVTLPNGTILSRAVTRDPQRRGLVKAITNAVDVLPVNPLTYGYDLLNRVKKRNTATFDYNARSEVIAASILSNAYIYAYDNIGNHTASSVNYVETVYDANNLNQYSQISVPFVPSVENPSYDADGNLLTNGVWSYTWDAENRLVTAYSNFACIVSNAYDHMSRRVLKVTPSKTHTFVYDGWNLVQEIVATSKSTTTNRFIWGQDLSGTMQGADGVGGLIAVSIDGACYFPFYDNNGNITAYANDLGVTVAQYIYDAFGCTIAKSGPLADTFPHRFSTKYYDAEIGLYYYGYRFYSTELMRWLSRDPIEEWGGENLYTFVINDPVNLCDPLGCDFIAVGSRPAKAALGLQNHMSIEFYEEKPACTKKGYTFKSPDVGKEPLKNIKRKDQFELIPNFSDYEHKYTKTVFGKTVNWTVPARVSFLLATTATHLSTRWLLQLRRAQPFSRRLLEQPQQRPLLVLGRFRSLKPLLEKGRLHAPIDNCFARLFGMC